jgi:putative hydrolase of the HAD superfamily
MKGGYEMTRTTKPILIFDMDDTLIPTQEVFNQTSLLVAKTIIQYLSLKLDIREIIEKMNQIDLENVKEMGFSPERYPTSWVQTFEWYANQYPSPTTKEQKNDIYQMAYSLYESVISPYSGTHETLSLLKELGYPLLLLTAGTVAIQEKRVLDANLISFFNEVIIVPMKNPVILKELLNERRITPANAYMIGNSLKSDIYPALEVGMSAIHLERDTWAFDDYQIDRTNKAFQVIHSIEEVISCLK